MKELVTTIVNALVDNVDKVQVNEIAGATSNIIEIVVAKDDLGKVIGKKGNTAYCIRNLVFAASFRTKKHYSINILSIEDANK
jgi:predicted RNA-binding protein YlqC (UPF0109 family)